MMCLARSVPGGSLAVLFFVRVNQVLVRLWARAMEVGPYGSVDIPLSGCMSDRESCPSGCAPQRSAARVQRRVKETVWLVMRWPRERALDD